jgi:hypothetical protein
MLRIGHVRDVHTHPIDDLCLAIGLGVERSVFCEIVVQQRLETWPKGVEEPILSIKDDGMWYTKVDPHSFKEYIASICHCDILLIGCEDGHLQNSINDHKHIVVSFLGEWKAIHVIH